MKYSQAREQIRSGDLLAWSHRGIHSWHDFKIWFVRLWQRSEYSHVGTAWVIGERVFVIEAVQPVVRNFPLSKLRPFYWLPMDAPWTKSTEATALDCIGDPYSQLQAMEAPFDTPPADHLWECAELVATVARNDGINLGRVYTPSAIVQAALARGATLDFVE